MNQSHKSDEYNFAQKSQSGKAGFEAFEGSDGRFYFHLNDAKGYALLYSQAYKKAKERDTGMASVLKNVAISDHYERKMDTAKKPYFVLRAGNKIEIARSRSFDNAADMETHIKYTKVFNAPKIVEEKPIVSVAPPTTIVRTTISSTDIMKRENDLKAENDSLKKRLILLENQLQQGVNTEGGGDVTDTKMPRHIFRVVVFNNEDTNRIHGKITHHLSEDTCLFSGVDSQTIGDFILSKMNIEPTEGVSNKVLSVHENAHYQVHEPVQPIAEVEENIKGEAHSDVQISQTEEIIAVNLVNAKDSIRANQAFALILTHADTAQIELGSQYFAKIYVFNFDTRERFLLLEKRGIWHKRERHIKVRIHPNALPMGSYRLTMTVDFGAKVGQTKPIVHNKWSGEGLVQVF